jgi:hypothetical protein
MVVQFRQVRNCRPDFSEAGRLRNDVTLDLVHLSSRLSNRSTTHFACTFDSLVLLISNEAYLYPRLDTDWPRALMYYFVRLELIGHMAAFPIGYACTFNFSASTSLYQRDILTSIVSVHAGRCWTCDNY